MRRASDSTGEAGKGGAAAGRRGGWRRGAALALALLALAAPAVRGAEELPVAAIGSVFPDWPAWVGGAERLAAAIDRFAALRDGEWRTAADLLAALRARDAVHREAARVDGFLSFRLDLDRRDEEALAHRPRMDALAARWDGASSWFEPRLRALDPPRLAAWLAADAIPEEGVRQVLAAARGAAPATARWHAARKKRLGLERYGPADLEVPLPGAPAGWSWAQARAQILAAVAPLGPEISGLFARAFGDGWIDAVERPAKRPLGFSTFVYGDHPFVSVVYRGSTADLFSLTHELGHAVHHALAFAAQPYEVSRPSTLVAETASAVAESLLARHLAAHAGSADQRAAVADLEARSIQRFFLATALDADFELAVHESQGSFAAARLGGLYRERLAAFYGGALDLDPWDGNGWLDTPHFFDAPLSMSRYGLSYAAATALVEQLLSPSEELRAAARQRYLALLRAGSSDAPLALLAAAGADLRQPATLAAIPRRLAELAAVVEK